MEGPAAAKRDPAKHMHETGMPARESSSPRRTSPRFPVRRETKKYGLGARAIRVRIASGEVQVTGPSPHDRANGDDPRDRTASPTLGKAPLWVWRVAG